MHEGCQGCEKLLNDFGKQKLLNLDFRQQEGLKSLEEKRIGGLVYYETFLHARAFHQQYTIKALGKVLTAFRDLCRALVH